MILYLIVSNSPAIHCFRCGAYVWHWNMSVKWKTFAWLLLSWLPAWLHKPQSILTCQPSCFVWRIARFLLCCLSKYEAVIVSGGLKECLKPCTVRQRDYGLRLARGTLWAMLSEGLIIALMLDVDVNTVYWYDWITCKTCYWSENSQRCVMYLFIN